jgi:3',5'-cyclic AMP phosphodiesterase CpdA
MHLDWITDAHLDFLEATKRQAFYDELAARPSSALLVGGDTAEAPGLVAILEAMASTVRRPVYFVLGNHDFYRSSITALRREASALTTRSPWLRWLPAVDVVPLTSDTALVGHDGWADGRAGDFAGSPVMLNDHRLIEDVAFLPKATLAARLAALGDEAAAHLDRVLPLALGRFAHVVVLTHVPPFVESCWHEGSISGPHWLPHFTCVAVGAVLRRQMQLHRHRQMTVLCGHTHGDGVAEILPNLRVITGGAAYGQPRAQEPLVVS